MRRTRTFTSRHAPNSHKKELNLDRHLCSQLHYHTPRIDYWLNTQSQITLSGLEPPTIRQFMCTLLYPLSYRATVYTVSSFASDISPASRKSQVSYPCDRCHIIDTTHTSTYDNPLIKPLVQLIYLIGVAPLFTSRNIPELPTTATHGLWFYLSEKSFFARFFSRYKFPCYMEKWIVTDSNCEPFGYEPNALTIAPTIPKSLPSLVTVL